MKINEPMKRRKHMKKFARKMMAVICMLNLSMGLFGMTVCAAEEDQQRAVYYEEYKKIVEKISSDTGVELTLLPAEEFAEEDWRTPEEFERVIREFATAEIVIEDSDDDIMDLLSGARSAVSASKNVSFVWGSSVSTTIKIKASFSTQYSSGRQYISGVSSISSSKASGNGTWKQFGSDYVILDAGRTAQVSASGTISYAGASTNKLLTVEFYCSATGGIS